MAKARSGSFYLGGGPYLALGVSGKATISNGSGQSQSEDLHFGSSTDDIKNPDFGINFLTGYQFTSGFTISAGYGLGLTNLINTSDVSLKNGSFNISLGYFFK